MEVANLSLQTVQKRYGISADDMIELYKKMLIIRRIEESCQLAYDRDKVGGYMHLFVGQEALAVGFIAAIRPDDYVLAGYRDHAYALTLGMTPEKMMAELFGRATGCSKGKGGSMHIFDKEHNFLGGYGIVAGHIPIATGVAFASKYRKTDQVALCFFGDGAMNAGVFHESANMAGLWKLPVVYVIENNLYALGTSVERATAQPELYKRADAYGMPGKRIDAMDVLNVRKEAQEAVDYVRAGNGPIMIEAMTYRLVGHGVADKPALQSYRSQDEVIEWRTHDPIPALGKLLVDENILDNDKLNELDVQAKQIASQAYEFADKSPEPPLSELFTDVYTDMKPEGHERWQ